MSFVGAIVSMAGLACLSLGLSMLSHPEAPRAVVLGVLVMSVLLIGAGFAVDRIRGAHPRRRRLALSDEWVEQQWAEIVEEQFGTSPR